MRHKKTQSTKNTLSFLYGTSSKPLFYYNDRSNLIIDFQSILHLIRSLTFRTWYK